MKRDKLMTMAINDIDETYLFCIQPSETSTCEDKEWVEEDAGDDGLIK